MAKRIRQKRTRPRRGKGQGISPPSRGQSKDHAWTEKDIEQLRELHAARTFQAQRTDEALKATIAPTPHHWIKAPGELDVHGVDYPEHKVPKAKKDLQPHERMAVAAAKAEAEEAKEIKVDEAQRLRERLSKLREDYAVQYETHLGAALSREAAHRSNLAYVEILELGYTPEQATISTNILKEKHLRQTQAEALAKAKKEAMDLADDAYGEVPELWEEGLQKAVVASVAESAAEKAVKAEVERAMEGLRPITIPPKPAPKPAAKARTESYDFYMDPGHGWLRVPLKRLEELGIANDISPYSYVKGQYAYLEEDRDARILTDTLAQHGIDVKLRDHTANRESSIRGYIPYRGPSYKRNVDAILATKTYEALGELEKTIYQDKALSEEEKKRLAEYIRVRTAHLLDQKQPEAVAETKEEPEALDAKKPLSEFEEIKRHIKSGVDPDAILTHIRIERPTADIIPELDAKLSQHYGRIYPVNELPEGFLLTGGLGDTWLKYEDKESGKRYTFSRLKLIKADDKYYNTTYNPFQPEKWGEVKPEEPPKSPEPKPKEAPQDDLLPSLKKPTAFSPEYSKDSGMYEVEIYHPETREKTVRRFSTPDVAEQYQRLINENPGWPLEGFKERIGADREPKYYITAENTLSRGSQALSYTVYERLPAKAKRYDTYVDGRPYKHIAAGTTEYRETPDKQRIIEDLTREYKGTAAVEFALHTHWTPALSMVERIAPASPTGDWGGKWMVWFKNREGRDMDPREGPGSRTFDTYGEALDFARQERGIYSQRGLDREAIWTPVPAPPTLPEELRSFTGKQDRFEVDPSPSYEGTWDTDKKAMEYRWVFKNTTGPRGIHTLDELREEHQKGEWRRRDRAEAAKHTRTLTHQKGAKRKEFDRKAMPLASAMVFNNNAVIEAEGDRVTVEGMDTSHVALMILRNLPNDMGIPDGKYEVADSSLDSRVTHLRHPKKIFWDNVERQLTVSNESQESSIRYEKVPDFKDRFPVPKVRHHVETSVDLDVLKKAADEVGEGGHLALKVTEGRSALESSFTYEATKHETLKRPPDEDHDYEWEETVEIPITGKAGEVEKATHDEVKAVYTASYLIEHLGRLTRAGFKDATLEYATDMPLKITATRDDGAEAEFWLAPCIGV